MKLRAGPFNDLPSFSAAILMYTSYDKYFSLPFFRPHLLSSITYLCRPAHVTGGKWRCFTGVNEDMGVVLHVTMFHCYVCAVGVSACL